MSFNVLVEALESASVAGDIINFNRDFIKVAFYTFMSRSIADTNNIKRMEEEDNPEVAVEALSNITIDKPGAHKNSYIPPISESVPREVIQDTCTSEQGDHKIHTLGGKSDKVNTVLVKTIKESFIPSDTPIKRTKKHRNFLIVSDDEEEEALISNKSEKERSTWNSIASTLQAKNGVVESKEEYLPSQTSLPASIDTVSPIKKSKRGRNFNLSPSSDEGDVKKSKKGRNLKIASDEEEDDFVQVSTFIVVCKYMRATPLSLSLYIYNLYIMIIIIIMVQRAHSS
jgi:hypothetical protein